MKLSTKNKLKNVVLASVLKPCLEPRMYQKLAKVFLAKNFNVTILGADSVNISNSPHNERVSLIPIFSGERLGLNRLKAQVLAFKNFYKVKPAIIVCCCADLLIVSVLYKIIFGTEIVYDIAENYKLNALVTGNFKGPTRYLVAGIIRGIERICKPFISQFWLAETVYATQMSFLVLDKTISVPNLAYEDFYNSISASKVTSSEDLFTKDISLVIYGTLGDNFGFSNSLALASEILNNNSNATLLIIGHSQPAPLKVKFLLDNLPEDRSRLMISKFPIENKYIIDNVLLADVVIMGYLNNIGVLGKIPTKVFECFAGAKPFLIPEEYWLNIKKEILKLKAINFSILVYSGLVKYLLVMPSNTKESRLVATWHLDNSLLKQLLSQF